MSQKFDASYIALWKACPRMRDARGALSENQELSPQTRIRTSTSSVPGRFAGSRTLLFQPLIWNFSELFCRAQRRAEIAEFVIDLGRSFDSLSNFFAEQRAIAFA
jgi:hypothetical protein